MKTNLKNHLGYRLALNPSKQELIGYEIIEAEREILDLKQDLLEDSQQYEGKDPLLKTNHPRQVHKKLKKGIRSKKKELKNAFASTENIELGPMGKINKIIKNTQLRKMIDMMRKTNFLNLRKVTKDKKF